MEALGPAGDNKFPAGWQEKYFQDKEDLGIFVDRGEKAKVKKEIGCVVTNLHTWKWKNYFGILATLLANLVILDKILNLSELPFLHFV